MTTVDLDTEWAKLVAGAYDPPVSRVRAELQAQLRDGVTCPVCGQLAKEYRRALTSTAARVLIAMYPLRAFDEYVHLPNLMAHRLPDVAHQGGYATLSQHWGLIEEERVQRPDGGRAGMWRLTYEGQKFVCRALVVPQYVHLYNNQVRGFSGPDVDITQVLGAHFDYQELMSS